MSRSSPENLTRTAVEKIRAAIVYGRLDLGEAISEKDIANALSMSKAPIRAALGELRVRGLIETVPQSGTYVFSPSRQAIEELCDFRLVLEEQALLRSMAVARHPLLTSLAEIMPAMELAFQAKDAFEFKLRDTDFHHTFVCHSGNGYLVSAYETITDVVEALRYRFMDTVIDRNRAFIEHQKILVALRSNRINRAIGVLREHISRTKQFHSNIQWSAGRSHRKDYKFRNYSDIFVDASTRPESQHGMVTGTEQPAVPAEHRSPVA
jgi:DNA-binding GntR family transcriptional regulator